jgi:transcriptional regulator with XRE-family HTH domain
VNGAEGAGGADGTGAAPLRSIPLSLARADGEAGGPAAAGKVLGTYLRRLRLQQGYTLKDVAPVIKGSLAKISRLERGESPAQPADVMKLLTFYGATDDEELNAIEGLLRQSSHQAWYHQFSDVVPGWLARLIGLESAADLILMYEMQYVPGLLQTSDYTRAVVQLAFPDPSALQVERRVELRLQRQQLLHQADMPRMVALLDEGLLMRPIGGPAVMRGQLRHLYNLAENKDGLNIRIVPFDAAARGAAPGAAMTYLRFPRGGPEEMVYLEQLHGARYVSAPREVEAYRQTFVHLQDISSTRVRTLELLDAAIGTFRE